MLEATANGWFMEIVYISLADEWFKEFYDTHYNCHNNLHKHDTKIRDDNISNTKESPDQRHTTTFYPKT